MAATIEQLELLKNNINARIKGINSRRLYYRRKAFMAFISTAALAALTSVLLGIHVEEKWRETIRITALIITTIITLINTYNAFFNHKELWVANNNALNKFYELGFNIEFFERGSQPLPMEKVDEYRKNYQDILNELNQIWHKSRTDAQTQHE